MMPSALHEALASFHADAPASFHEWAGASLPSLMPSVHPLTMPLALREQILDIVLAKEIERLEAGRIEAGKTGAKPLAAAPLLPDDPKVREVLENGGFSFLGYTRRGQEEWEYERVSRDGLPLTGKEAKCPPRYKVTSLGDIACFCDCPFHAKPGQPDKHVQALTWVLMQKSPEQGDTRT